MAIADTSAFTKAYKYTYGADAIKEQIVQRNVLLAQLRESAGTTVIAGRSMLVPIQKRHNQSYRGQGELQAVAEPGVPQFDEASVPINTISASTRYSVQAKRQAQAGGDAAFFTMQLKLMDSTMGSFLQSWSHDLQGDGTGAKAKISSGGGTTSLVVFANQASGTWTNYFGPDHLREGMMLSSHSATTGTTVDSDASATITDINDSTNTLTVSGQVAGFTNNDYLYIGSSARSSKGQVFMGSRGAFDDGTVLATYLGIDKTAAGNRYWKGNVTTGIGGKNLELEFRKMCRTIRKRSGMTPHMVYTTEGVADQYMSQIKAERRQTMPLVNFGNGAIEYRGGADAIAFKFDNQNIPIVTDVDGGAGLATFYNFDTCHMGYVPEGQPDWLNEEGEGIWKHVREYLSYEAILVAMGEFYCDQPNANGILTGITEVN